MCTPDSGEGSSSVYSRLWKENVFFSRTVPSPDVCELHVAQILQLEFLQSQDTLHTPRPDFYGGLVGTRVP